MFYTNNGATLYTELDIIDNSFSATDEKEYKSIKEKIDNVLEWKSHAVVDTKK